MSKPQSASSSQSASGIGHVAQAIVCSTRSGRVTPQTVDVIRGSRIENWSATAPSGTPWRAQIASMRMARSTDRVGRLQVGETAAGTRRLGQDAAAIGRGVEHGHAARHGEVDQRLRRSG